MRFVTTSIALAASVLLAGCGLLPDTQEPPAESSAPSQPAETEAPEPGSAEALLPDFLVVLDDVDAAHDAPDGDAAVDALVEAGFDRAAIERTGDLDSLGQPVTLLEVAVRVDDACLVGQIGQGDATATVMPVLASGACLVGATVAVD